MVKRFECLRCGNCCRGESTVSLSWDEIEKISRYLGLKREELQEKFLILKNGRIEMKVLDGYCIFFDRKEKICQIHPVKPTPCKIWPLHPSILSDFDSYLIIRDSCIGLAESSYDDICKIIRGV